MNVTVVGLGKIGLPLAAYFALRGQNVLGLDVNAAVVDLVNQGVEPFPGESQLAETLTQVVGSGALRATTSYEEAITHADTIIVVVPLIVDASGRPDFSILDSATRELGAHLRPGSVVIYETTLPVGTTRGRWRPMLEAASGLREGSDFHIVFSPERVLTGRVFQDLRRYPKLVGGLSPKGTARARDFYEEVLDFEDRPDLDRPNGVWDLGTAEAAEMAKLAETTYRDVNIALVNEFARFTQRSGIDIHAVIEACNSQPYSHLHRPGVSVGGHCIPVYPRLYLANDPDASVVAAARSANERMPAFTVELLAEALDGLDGRTVAVLGAAYRGGVKETAFSGDFALVDEIEARGGKSRVHDPLYAAEELVAMGFTPLELGGDPVAGAIVHTDHAQYQSLGPADLPGVAAIVDGRRVLRGEDWPGVDVVHIGVSA